MNLVNLDLFKIDETNRDCYDNLACEYDEVDHETCRDFDFGNELFLKYAINEYNYPKGLRYLDVGVGTGKSLEFIADWLIQKEAHIEVLDISKKMLDVTHRKFGHKISNYHNISIHDFKPTDKYDLIVSTMCDPFLTSHSLEVYKNSLNDSGILLITYPSKKWAKKVRKGIHHQTTFHNKDRVKFISYSFCWNEAKLIKQINNFSLLKRMSKLYLLDDK